MTEATPLTGRSVLVTGASRGLGRGFAVALAAAGADLVLNGRDPEALEDLARELRGRGSRVVTVSGSVAEEDVARRAVAAAVEEFGGLDVLVNNAGITRDRSALKMSTAEFDDVVAVNLRGAWLCGTAAMAAMRGGDRPGGVILNVVSEVAFYGAFGQSNYAAAKAGLVALTLTWAVELAKQGIRVNAFSPAALTDMSQVVMDRATTAAAAAGEAAPVPADLGIGLVEEIAPLVVHLVSDASADLTGQVFSFDGRHLGVWSHPETTSVAHRPSGWTADGVAEAFRSGELVAQRTHRPSWVE
ncbi:SDR family NAD(P)-dependent oxidoreductase [Nakamurella sp. YIM 132087]|uniref:SDR family NAD(P)-dependent oxidoreductase n=1 Tax=Nakamurella alba TaxID=2665158 RepID=A0A7K1FT35_9ACTN|nr:SDR family NAD(P)-dependent oxidoreductase [Nakamurella alba]MTD15974.1 SDR family NAD(P)-dependent oxidoreductase [Nakamurella alba]